LANWLKTFDSICTNGTSWRTTKRETGKVASEGFFAAHYPEQVVNISVQLVLQINLILSLMLKDVFTFSVFK
jgi:hypothetical protein